MFTNFAFLIFPFFRLFAFRREQQLLNVFEVVVSTLEGKLQRIDNLDKAVEHLMRRVEQLDNRVGDNIHKTESIISKLRNLDNKISVETHLYVKFSHFFFFLFSFQIYFWQKHFSF